MLYIYQNILLLVSCIILSLVGSLSQAQFDPWPIHSGLVVTQHMKGIDYRDFDVLTCSALFSEVRYGTKIFKLRPDNHIAIEQAWLPASQQPPHVVRLVEKTLSFWHRTGHYNQEQINHLRRIDRSLPPIRTHYLQIDYLDHTSSIRIFDGSENVINGIIPWHRVPRGGSVLTPIERIYNYRFPERQQEGGAFIIEMGLLGNPKVFKDGVYRIFDAVAQFIDTAYNQMNYRTFGDLRIINQRNLQIYGIARPALVEHYAQYGLRPVMVSDGSGDWTPFQFPDGMILLKVSGSEWIERHLEGHIFPSVEGEPLQARTNLITPSQHQLNLSVDHIPIFQISSMADFWQKWNEIVYYYSNFYYNSPAQSLQREQSYRYLVEGLYVLYKSEVYWRERHPAIAAYRFDLIKSLLTTDSSVGWPLLNTMVLDLEISYRQNQMATDLDFNQ
jgi:hypothetical protein